VLKAPTRTLNPTVPEHVIESALADDEPRARAEYLAEFRTDVEQFVSLEALRAAIIPGRVELPPEMDVQYVAFVDVSGGSSDSMTLAITHRDRMGRAVLGLSPRDQIAV
jgi:hypothetical protein